MQYSVLESNTLDVGLTEAQLGLAVPVEVLRAQKLHQCQVAVVTQEGRVIIEGTGGAVTQVPVETPREVGFRLEGREVGSSQ